MALDCVDLEYLLSQPRVSIFGYGSLIWRPGFSYDATELGFIRGYSRRFWQKSTHHRGTEDNPGRVLTSIEDEDGKIYGITYHVTGRDRILRALEALGLREVVLGGYTSMMMDFYPATNEYSSREPSCQVVLYIALPSNELYCGDLNESEFEIAKRVAMTSGFCGPNSDYIFKLADFMKEKFPDIEEPHLYEIDFYLAQFVREIEERKNLKNVPTKKVVDSSSMKVSSCKSPFCILENQSTFCDNQIDSDPEIAEITLANKSSPIVESKTGNEIKVAIA
ncbi:glutathione-specific gamma-glutamylcyclotransferase 1-like isoform X2 [Convolutriloba macropyga]